MNNNSQDELVMFFKDLFQVIINMHQRKVITDKQKAEIKDAIIKNKIDIYLLEDYKKNGIIGLEEYLLDHLSVHTPCFNPLPRKRTMSFGEQL